MSAVRKAKQSSSMMHAVNTKHIADGFSKGAQQYDQYACVQKQVALEAIVLKDSQCKRLRHKHASTIALNQGLFEHSNTDFRPPEKTILDVGCGTAYFVDQIKQGHDHYIGLDISKGMLEVAAQRINSKHAQHSASAFTLLHASADNIPLDDHSVDTVFSSMALQWCVSQAAVLKEMYRVLSDTGSASLAIVVDGSFMELEQAWSNIGLPSRLNKFSTANSWIDAAIKSGFDVEASTHIYTDDFDSALSMLRSIKGIGANTRLSDSQLKLTKTELLLLDKHMRQAQQASAKQILPLSYNIVHLRLSK